MELQTVVELAAIAAGFGSALLSYLGKREKTKQLRAVIEGVEIATRRMEPSSAKALKAWITSSALRKRVEKELNVAVKEVQNILDS